MAVRTVLVIGEVWPYHRGAGNLVHAVARHLPEYGWQPIVVTAPLPENVSLPFEAHTVPYRDVIRGFARAMGLRTDSSLRSQVEQELGIRSAKSPLAPLFAVANASLTYPDGLHGWRRRALRVCSELAGEGKAQAILTDNPPVSAQLVAAQLKKRYGTPWLVYFSHLWSNNNGYSYGRIRQSLDRRLELRTIRYADGIVTHSAPQAERVRSLHADADITWCNEGFDPDTLNLPSVPVTSAFTITYTGSFAPGLREPRTLLLALARLIESGELNPDRLAVRFVGPPQPWVDGQIAEAGLQRVARQQGMVPMVRAIELQRESQVLYNPKWDDPQDPGIYSGKLFEYMAALRPVLATGLYPDVVDELVAETGIGYCTRTVDETAGVLRSMYRSYEKDGRVPFIGDIARIRRYSHLGLAEHMAARLDNVATRQRTDQAPD